jgi:hypothetical protein
VVGEDDVAGEHALHQQEAAHDEHLPHQFSSTLPFFALPSPQHFILSIFRLAISLVSPLKNRCGVGGGIEEAMDSMPAS